MERQPLAELPIANFVAAVYNAENIKSATASPKSRPSPILKPRSAKRSTGSSSSSGGNAATAVPLATPRRRDVGEDELVFASPKNNTPRAGPSSEPMTPPHHTTTPNNIRPHHPHVYTSSSAKQAIASHTDPSTPSLEASSSSPRAAVPSLPKKRHRVGDQDGEASNLTPSPRKAAKATSSHGGYDSSDPFGHAASAADGGLLVYEDEEMEQSPPRSAPLDFTPSKDKENQALESPTSSPPLPSSSMPQRPPPLPSTRRVDKSSSSSSGLLYAPASTGSSESVSSFFRSDSSPPISPVEEQEQAIIRESSSPAADGGNGMAAGGNGARKKGTGGRLSLLAIGDLD